MSHSLFKRDYDYVVVDDEVLIVDEHTGRMLPGRRYSDGLHQALEAKEGVTIENETQTLASITLQNFFRLYSKLAGMTGTAATEAEEFHKIYKLDVVTIPTNKPMVREDKADLIFLSKKGKYKAIVDDVKERHQKGQPVLIGTIAVETSELLSTIFKMNGIKHEVLNAKNHSREAEIVSHAGEAGHVIFWVPSAMKVVVLIISSVEDLVDKVMLVSLAFIFRLKMILCVFLVAALKIPWKNGQV